ncbi:Uncharacterised protein [uncultured archaeon]|nr:Uncharacterised protein [uncultured archaeon]
MRTKSGQVSMEYIMILGALLLILGLLMVIFLGQYNQQSLIAQNRMAEHTLTVLADEAQQVRAGGPGAEHKVVVEFPPTVDLSRSSISDKLMQLYMGGIGDVSRGLTFNVSGQWPARTGRSYMSLYNNGTHVLIRPAGLLAVNVTGIYMRMQAGSGNSTNLSIVNQANVSYVLGQTLSCPELASCAYGGSNGTLSAGAQQAPSLSINSNTNGTWAGWLQINATPAAGSGLPNETITIPLTIRVG